MSSFYQDTPLICGPVTTGRKTHLIPIQPQVSPLPTGIFVQTPIQGAGPFVLWESFIPGGCSIAARLSPFTNVAGFPSSTTVSFAIAAHGDQPAQLVHREIANTLLGTLFEFDHVTRIVAFRPAPATGRLEGEIASFVCGSCCGHRLKSSSDSDTDVSPQGKEKTICNGGGTDKSRLSTCAPFPTTNIPSIATNLFTTSNAVTTIFEPIDLVPTLVTFNVGAAGIEPITFDPVIVSILQADGTVINRQVSTPGGGGAITNIQAFVCANVIRIQIIGPVLVPNTSVTVSYALHTTQCLTCVAPAPASHCAADSSSSKSLCVRNYSPRFADPRECSMVGLGLQNGSFLQGQQLPNVDQTIFESFPHPARQVTLEAQFGFDGVLSIVTRSPRTGEEEVTIRNVSSNPTSQLFTIPNAVRIQLRFFGAQLQPNTLNFGTYKCLSC